MKEVCDQYRTEPDDFWRYICAYGGDGYQIIALARKMGWRALPSWGRDGWDLGNWPLVIMFWHEDDQGSDPTPALPRSERERVFEVIEYVEGDVTLWRCPSSEVREQVTDELAFWHWKYRGEDWVEGIEHVEDMPAHLRGPFRWEDADREQEERGAV